MKTLIYFLIMLLSSFVGDGIEKEQSKCSYGEYENSYQRYYLLPEAKLNYGTPSLCEEESCWS